MGLKDARIEATRHNAARRVWAGIRSRPYLRFWRWRFGRGFDKYRHWIGYHSSSGFGIWLNKRRRNWQRNFIWGRRILGNICSDRRRPVDSLGPRCRFRSFDGLGFWDASYLRGRCFLWHRRGRWRRACHSRWGIGRLCIRFGRGGGRWDFHSGRRWDKRRASLRGRHGTLYGLGRWIVSGSGDRIGRKHINDHRFRCRRLLWHLITGGKWQRNSAGGRRSFRGRRGERARRARRRNAALALSCNSHRLAAPPNDHRRPGRGVKYGVTL